MLIEVMAVKDKLDLGLSQDTERHYVGRQLDTWHDAFVDNFTLGFGFSSVGACKEATASGWMRSRLSFTTKFKGCVAEPWLDYAENFAVCPMGLMWLLVHWSYKLKAPKATAIFKDLFNKGLPDNSFVVHIHPTIFGTRLARAWLLLQNPWAQAPSQYTCSTQLWT